jgi:predicted neuraminidase
VKYEVEHHEYVFMDLRPFQSCHASTLEVLPNGDVVAAWFGGTKEGAPDVAVWCSCRRQGVWSEPVKVADEDDIPLWNPVLFAASNGVIHLYYKAGKSIKTQTIFEHRWKTYVISSQDEGRTWSHPKELVEGDVSGGRGPVKNKPIVLHNGVWAAPASIEDEEWNAFVDLSYDGGETWVKSDMVPLSRVDNDAPELPDGPVPPVPASSLSGKGVIQPTLWESQPGNVHMLLRSTAGYIYRSDSRDAGKTWSEAYPTALPNNNSGVDVAALPDGMLALVYNPVPKNWGPRTPLIISLSRDNGNSWTDNFVLENEPGEYSYPAVVCRGSHLYLTYTWRRERIAYWKIAVQE